MLDLAKHIVNQKSGSFEGSHHVLVDCGEQTCGARVVAGGN